MSPNEKRTMQFLADEVHKLDILLQSPEYGVRTWWDFVANRLHTISTIYENLKANKVSLDEPHQPL